MIGQESEVHLRSNLNLVATEKDWYKQFPVNYVDTNTLTVDELEAYFMGWLKEKGL